MTKIVLTFKTPDVSFYACQYLSEDEKNKCNKVLQKFVDNDEYVEIEFDTEIETAKVLEV